jgi:hypothetical protein
MASSIAVLIEEGRTRTFASALDWPGWSRSAKSAHDALAVLDDYRERYAAVLASHSLDAPAGRLGVVETVPGDATTDFGAPSQIAVRDRRAMRRADRDRMGAILEASWASFDDAAATTGKLRQGPRGGGRSVQKMAAHVADAEVAYARALGLRVSAADDEASVAALRARLLGLVAGTVEPDRDGKWPLRYGVRRIAWHVLDHLFEMEDRDITR